MRERMSVTKAIFMQNPLERSYKILCRVSGFQRLHKFGLKGLYNPELILFP